MRAALPVLFVLAGCSIEQSPLAESDAGGIAPMDAASVDAGRRDAAPRDGWAPPRDAFVPPDAPVDPVDAFVPPADAFVPPTDATVPPTDGCTPSAEVCNGRDDDCDGLRDETGCPCDVVDNGGNLYQFCTTSRSWVAARDACRAVGYELVTLETAAEDAWVFAEAMSRRDEDWWLGLNDRAVEGTFVWVSGISASYRNWSSGQPNDFAGQDCVTVDNGGFLEDRGQWNDRGCGDSRPYVCEHYP